MSINFKRLCCLYSLFFFAVNTQLQAQLDTLTALDLRLSSGANSSDLDFIAKPLTADGKDIFSEIILNPSTNCDLLYQRQQVLRALVHYERLSQASRVFGLISADEQKVRAIFFDKEQQTVLRDVLKSFLFSNSFLKRFNFSEKALNGRYVVQTFSPLLAFILEFGVLHFAGKYFTDKPSGKSGHAHDHVERKCSHGHGKHKCSHSHDKHSDHKKDKKKDSHSHHGAGDHSGCVQCISTDNLMGAKKGFVLTAKALHIALHLWTLKDMVDSLRSKLALLQHVQDGIDALNRVCANARSVVIELRKASSERDVLFNQMLHDIESSLSALKIKTRTTQRKKLHVFSPLGSLVAEYQRLSLAQKKIGQLFHRIGMLDVYVAVAQTILVHSGQQNKYCYATFVDDEKPQFHMEHGWLPVLEQSPDRVIVSQSFDSETLGSQKYVLSGPNGAGKSTFLRSLGCNVVLAQSFGIAAAQSFVLTPFKTITSFMSVEDDVHKGLSSFIAKYKRAEELHVLADSLAEDRSFGLFLLDDSLGQGTTPTVGQEFALRTLKRFAQNDKVLMLAATHLPALVEHARDYNSQFRNITIPLRQDEDGSFASSYTVTSGVADQRLVSMLVA